MKRFMFAIVLAMNSTCVYASELREPLAAALIKVKAGEAVILDVREASDVKAGIVEKAIWLANSEIQAKGARYTEILASLPKDKPVYVYCATGTQADAFADVLDGQGFKASSLGGFMELTAAGFTAAPAPDAKAQPCPYLCGK